MPHTVRIDPNSTQQQAAVIPDATPFSDGVMSRNDKVALDTFTVSRPIIPQTRKSLQNGVPTALIVVDISKCGDSSFASTMQFACEVTDGVDVQIRSGTANINVAFRPPGTYATSQAQTSTPATTKGNLTVTFSWTTSGNTATLLAEPNSTLIPTELHIDFYMNFASHPSAVSVSP